MELFERAKALADQAAAKTKEGVEEGKLKLDLHRAYAELGRRTFELVEKHELEPSAIEDLVARIRDLEAQAEKRQEAAEPEPDEA